MNDPLLDEISNEAPKKDPDKTEISGTSPITSRLGENISSSTLGEQDKKEEGKGFEIEAKSYTAMTKNKFAKYSLNAPRLTKRFDPTEKFRQHLEEKELYKLEERYSGEIIELRKVQARPAGSSYLGTKSVGVLVHLCKPNGTLTRLIADSGSQITLISEELYSQIDSKPKKIQGCKINLVQVTGSTTIQGYIKLPIYFPTEDGPVKIEVEAYIVKGMSAPFILGNDFSDQYELSILRSDGECQLLLGRSLRTIEADSSVDSPKYLDEEGHSFSVRVREDLTSSFLRSKQHRRNKRLRIRTRRKEADEFVRSEQDLILPPSTCVKVKVRKEVFKNHPIIYAERLFSSNSYTNDIFAAPDSIITEDQPYLQVSNFSERPIRISSGQPLARLRDPEQYLDKDCNIDTQTKKEYEAYAALVRALTQEQGFSSAHDDFPHRKGDEPVEGGPKVAENPPEEINKSDLFSQVKLSPDLTKDQTNRLKRVIEKNESAFGLDGRLGNYPAKVKIRMKENAKPVSLPPFPQSPAKREVIDKQMDSWIQLGVIEPSVSPWGAPTFITYRNGKPRMVIDYRKLNKQVIPDEFPLPKQEDILQALTGSSWLTTLDALAGFTQLEMEEESKETTGFRSHHGLYQFRRLPFGYRNGPSVFQRVMQNVLAPYLWIFTLVYIDDIVIYSKTFDDHLVHIDHVLGAIAKAGITLSPPKCNFAFQSLILLGQKVSRLGMSTHKSKIDAILELQEPRNIKELRTFLGMMVYFSAYIPYYAWIVAPLFKLLRKGSIWKWESLEQESFDLSKKVLTNAPVRAYAMPGRGYRLYSDACDYGLGAILQQVQPTIIRDLRGTKLYEKLKEAHLAKKPIPNLVVSIGKDEKEKTPCDWAENFEDTMVEVERVIAYWSRTLKAAERNYSPTEREALALKEGLIKFQAYVEGEELCAITDHAALTWSRTFQNLERITG